MTTKLCDDDYLLDVTIRVSVRKQDAAALISSASKQVHDETEEDRVISAILELVEQGIFENPTIVEFFGSTTRRVSTVNEFENFSTLGARPTRVSHGQRDELQSPLAKKKNKGKKISLDTADRLFAGFEERLNRLPDHEEFGASAPLVLLFGSYLRREPEVGDIDLAVMTVPKANHDLRMEQLIQARRSSGSFLDYLLGPEKELLQFLKNRSSWLAIHDFSEVVSLKDVLFKVVHHSAEFQPLVSRFQRKQLSAKQFLEAADNLRRGLYAGASGP